MSVIAISLIVLLIAQASAQDINFPGQVFSAYPDYTGELSVSASSINLAFVDTSVTITYTNLIADDTCTTADDTSSNSCGIHIHSGSSCDSPDLVGGHFYNGEEDPWLTAAYMPGSGSLTVDFGYGYSDSQGLTFVIHDRTGARIACEILESPLTVLHTQELVTYPGYTGDVVSTVSSIFVDFGCDTCTDGLVSFSFTELSADPDCSDTASSASNSCGIHIHEGFTCDDAGGHFYMGETDPWSDIGYAGATTSLSFLVDMGGYGYLDTVGRVVVVHDRDGNRVTCVPLLEPTSSVRMAGPLGAYPGYTGDLSVSATSVDMVFSGTTVDISYSNLVGDSACDTVDSGASNSCGIHIHSGTSCLDADDVGGHYYSGSSDPWTNVVYTPGSGSVSVDYGYAYDVTVGRVLVIHDRTGARISCNLILPSRLGQAVVSGTVDAYPDYTGGVVVSADSIQVAYRDDSVTIAYENLAADSACTEADFAASNSCGIHIHQGFTCDDASGHFYNSDLSDPWLVAYYTPGSGSVTVTYGYDYTATRGRVLTIHDRTGARIACTPLTDLDSWTVDYQTLNVYEGYTGDVTVELRASLMFTGTGVAIAYDITGDSLCAEADTAASNSCGIHLHDGAECPTGGHFYDSALSDPWGVAYYMPGSGGLMVENGKSWSDTWGSAAFVIHDVTGARIACVILADDPCLNDPDGALEGYGYTCVDAVPALTCGYDLSALGGSGTIADFCPGSCDVECIDEDESSTGGVESSTGGNGGDSPYDVLCLNTDNYLDSCDDMVSGALALLGITDASDIDLALLTPYCLDSAALAAITPIVASCCTDALSFCDGSDEDDDDLSDDDDGTGLDAAGSVTLSVATLAVVAALLI